MATGISKKKGLNHNSENESKTKRIITHTNIYLPDEILQHIFTFLPIKSLAQTTLLSKHWNYLCLWRSSPRLDFSGLSMELIPTVLSRRKPRSNITYFRLNDYITDYSLRNCIKRVMKRGLEHLELEASLDSTLILSFCSFVCKTLKVLKLNHQYHARRVFDFEQALLRRDFCWPTPFPSVHTLSLTNAHFLDGGELFSGKNFPLLRKLRLEDCRGMTNLYIRCPGLEILELDRLCVNCLYISGTGLLELRVTMCFPYANSLANVVAPSLQSIYWEGRVSVNFKEESFRDLKTFSLRFYKAPNRAALQSLSTLLSAICSVRYMVFGSGSRVLETLSKMDSKGGLPCSFNNLVTLELHTKMTKDEITGIVCLLKSSPILRTITITANTRSNTSKKWNEKRYWISQIDNLKSIEFHLKVARNNI